MIQFKIPPEYCLIVNAFNQSTSLRGAAALLGVDPPALVRKVRKISTEFGYLQKIGNRWAVTEAGRRVAIWTDEMIKSQSDLSQEGSSLRISSFSWLAEEMLIPEFFRLKRLLGERQSCTFQLTAVNQEQELLHGRTDLVIQGHAPIDPTVAYKKIVSYNWLVVVPHSWRKSLLNLNESQIKDFLNKKPFIRHSSLNPESVLGFHPLSPAPISADGVIGIRSAVIFGLGWSVLPHMAVARYLQDNKLEKVNLRTNLKDEVSVWWLRARKDLSEETKAIIKWVSDFSVNI